MLAYLAIFLAGFYGTQVAAVQQADLAFGREQVEKFIHDRPGAGAIINQHRAFKEQLALLFADSGQGNNGKVERIHWDNREPKDHVSDHVPVRPNSPSLVHVSNRAKLSPIDTCVCLVFELLNARSDRHTLALAQMVGQRQISRDDYARSIIHSEYEVDKKTKEFLRKYPLGDVNAKENPEYASTMTEPDDFSGYVQYWESHKDQTKNPLEYYRKQYDQILAGEYSVK